MNLFCVPTVLLVTTAAFAEPIRVLYRDESGSETMAPGKLHALMRDLGRDAIYFDYAAGAAKPDAKYDLILRPDEVHDDTSKAKAHILESLRPERRAKWEKFLAGREEEKREKRSTVANYEKRPEPLTFQLPFSVKGSMERTQVPADCHLQLFASEPEIGKPIAMAWDERGRCWVAETADYPHGVQESGEGQDSIKICEDTNGDGKADKFTVFADKLNIPTGLVFVNGGIIVSQPPRFLFLKDTNGDDKADIRQEILTGWGIRDTHAQASNLHYGFDNWIYGCVGYSGFDGQVGGRTLQFGMGTYRFKPDGSALEFLHQFTNNAWGHGTNLAGDQFGGTANGAPLFYGGIPASVFPPSIRGMSAKKINVVDLCHTITPNFRQVDVFGGYTAAAGANILNSPALPSRFQDCAMICEPTMKVVALMKLVPDGAGYKALDYFNLFASSDEWNSPVHAEVGPDGAVWIADFQNFIIQHNPTPSSDRGGYVAKTGIGGAHENELRDHTRGRIYRVWGKDLPLLEKKPSLTGPTLWARLTAQRLIAETKGPLPQLPDSPHTLWAAKACNLLTKDLHKAALLSKDAIIRRNAVRALGSDKDSQELYFGTGVFADPDLHTRLAALVKLGEFESTPEIKTLITKLQSDNVIAKDEWLTEALRMLSKRHEVSAFKEGPNLLVNAGFEETKDGIPVGWKRRDYNGPSKKQGNEGAQWAIVTSSTHSGKHALRCITRDEADTSFFQDVVLKPNTTYRLSGWVKTHALRGKVSYNDHLGRAETNKITARDADWTEVEVVFKNVDKPKASINVLHVAKGDGYFDDVKLCEVIPIENQEDKPLAGDIKKGEALFWNHPVAACKNCHILKGQGSAVGPALDGIASRKDENYINEALMQPNARLAEGFEKLGVSPMPPMGLILKPQEVADVRAFILSLK
ncbi:MAG: c-type cytochrome [Verrucomicrobiaceae bacterium]|nr:c-type cytochrome [Verrucomicrobiaceae bacterium]